MLQPSLFCRPTQTSLDKGQEGLKRDLEEVVVSSLGEVTA